jgi:hypothetical protein
MRYTPLTWYEQENEPYQGHFGIFPLNTSFTSCFDEGWTPKVLRIGANGPHALTKLTN